MAYGIGASLANYGSGQGSDAMQQLGQAAQAEEQRNLTNKQLESERKAGNAQLGATGGALAGFAMGGPWGAVAGGAIGMLAGGLF